MSETINLGQVSSFYSGNTPPSNTKLIWYDTTIDAHKAYVPTLGVWVLVAPSVGNGFRLFANPNTDVTLITISQATHGVIEVANVQVMEYLVPPDDFLQSVDYVAQGIVVRIKPSQEVEVENPNGLMLSIKISGRV